MWVQFQFISLVIQSNMYNILCHSLIKLGEQNPEAETPVEPKSSSLNQIWINVIQKNLNVIKSWGCQILTHNNPSQDIVSRLTFSPQVKPQR